VSTISIKYFRFDEIASSALERIKSLQEVVSLELTDNHLCSLSELNRLGSLTNLESLVISENEVISVPLFRLYAIYRLIHLTVLNGSPVTNEERLEAEARFNRLGNVCFQGRAAPPWVNPHGLPRAIMGIPPSIADSKAATYHKRSLHGSRHAASAARHTEAVTAHACQIDQKIQKLNKVWPELLQSKIDAVVEGLVDQDKWAENILLGMRTE